MPAPESSELPPEPSKSFDRRRFIRWAVLAGAGALTVQKADLFKQAWGELGDIAAVLAPERAMSTVSASEAMRSTYAMFLAAHGFQNVPTSVVIAPHLNRHGAVQNSLPPENLWKNILPTLRVVDRLAKELGEKVHINSAYRSPAYNATCPGAAKWSQHLRNNALDIQFRSAPREVVRAARSLRDEGVFRGGIGLYSSFMHIDTRGENRDWQA